MVGSLPDGVICDRSDVPCCDSHTEETVISNVAIHYRVLVFRIIFFGDFSLNSSDQVSFWL